MVLIKSIAANSAAVSGASTVTRHSLTDSPRGPSGPASSVRDKCPIQACHSFSFIPYFHCAFSMFRYTNTYLCIIIACSIQYRNKLHRPRSNRLYLGAEACSRLHRLGVGKCTLSCGHEDGIS